MRSSLKEKRRRYIFEDLSQFTEITRDQVKGAELLLCEIDSIIAKIRDFPRLNASEIDIGGGALFYGPKGTGKTYAAQYVATATKGFARFVDIRGFPRAIIGEREATLAIEDIRALFQLSREYVLKRRKPVILFYDEFEEADNEILEELRIQLSGIEKRINGVYLLFVSTSAPNELDERLFRPGRISDLIQFTALTPRGQEEVLRYAVSCRPHSSNIDFGSIVHLSDDIDTPAALVEIAEHAFKAAAQEDKEKAKIEQRHLVLQYLRCVAGQPAEETLDDKGLWMVALHEAGHTVLASLLGIRVRFVTILPQLRDANHHGQTSAEFPSRVAGREDLENFLAFRFGGLIGEKLFGHRNLLTIEDDIRDITSAIQVLVEKLGGGKKLRRRYGYLALNRPRHEYSDGLRRIIEQDMGQIAKQAFCRAWGAVRKANRAKVKTMIEKVARALLRKKILIRNEIEEILNK